MKLLVVCQYFYPEQFRLNDVCFNLAASGHEVTVLTGLPNYPQGEVFPGYGWKELEEIEQSGIKLQSTDLRYDKHLNAFVEQIHGVKVIRVNLRPRLSGKKNLAKNYLSFIKEGNKVSKSMAQLYKSDVEKGLESESVYSFDKIIVFQYSPVTMALPAITFKKKSGADIPIYLYCFDLWPESIVSAGLSKTGPIYYGIKLLSKYIYAQADGLWISSHKFKNYFIHKLKVTKPFHYLPIYAEQLFLTKKSSTSPQSNNKINFLFAGNIGEMQSVETILYACNLVLEKGYNPVFHMVGEGSSYKKITDLSAYLGLPNSNIIFYGQHPLSEMPHFYDMADAFLVTLKKDEFISYTLPGKVQSYLAYGKPIVAAIDGEASRVITDASCGFVGAAEDYETLSSNIIRFMELSPLEREEYGDSAREYYENHFSQKIFFENLDKLLAE